MADGQFEYRHDGLRKIDSDEADPFGHRDYAATVATALELLPPRFTMGIFGPWGSGKSTILEEVRRRITADSAEVTSGFILFDAWRYEGDSLRREFLKVSGRSLREQNLVDEDVVKELDESLDVDEVTPNRPVMRLLDPDLYRRAGVGAVAVASIILAAVFGLPQLGLEKETILAFLLAISSALMAFGLLALQPVMSPTPVQKTRRRAEFPDEFSAAFRTLLDNVEATRLVFAIDNLDRCSPARVTQTLATVKTFLEPALGEGSKRQGRTLEQICFIIAADDNALRRHLTAQELSESGMRGAGMEDSDLADGELPREVRDAVDEYLRKFFGASMRIRDVLDEDISRFCEGEFAEFFSARPELGKETRRDLVEMASQALKRNPRRIVQFVNNLALRLDLLEERLRRGRILIKPEVLLVAKLAILEEEFPERFSELKEAPQLLDSWEDEARAPIPADSEDAEGSGNKKSEKERLNDFLRFTDHVRGRHLRAYLDLKQGRDELELDRHAELVEMLDGGDVAGIGSLLDEIGDQEDRYVQAAARHFDRQARRGNWGKAHNSLRVVSEVPSLHGKDGAIMAKLLDESLSHPRLTRRLPQLDAAAILGAGEKVLNTPQFNRLVLAFSMGMGDPDDSDARRRISEAIAEHAGSLTNGTAGRLQTVIGADEVRGDFRSYVRLAEAAPGVTGPAVATTALEQLQGLVGEERAGNGPELRVAAIAIGRTLREDQCPRLIDLGRAILDQLRDRGSDEYEGVAHSLRVLLKISNETVGAKGGQLPGAMERAQLCAAVAENWSSVPLGSKWEALQLGYELCVAGTEADDQAGFELGQKVLDVEDGVDLEAWLMARVNEMPTRFGGGVHEEMAHAIAGSRPRLSIESAQKFVSRLSADEQAAVASRAIQVAVAEHRSDRLDDLLGALSPEGVGTAVAQIAQRLRDHPGEVEQRGGEADFLVAHQDLLDDEYGFELAMDLAQAFDEQRGLTLSVAPLIGRLKFKDSEKRLVIVQKLLKIEADMTAADRRVSTLTAAIAAAGKRPSNARGAAVGRLRERLGAGDADVVNAARRLLEEAGEMEG